MISNTKKRQRPRNFYCAFVAKLGVLQTESIFGECPSAVQQHTKGPEHFLLHVARIFFVPPAQDELTRRNDLVRPCVPRRMAQGHDPVDPVGGDNPTKSQIKQSWQDWFNVHDQALFHAPVAPGQLAPWQFVKGFITDDEAMVLAQRAAITPLAELLMPFRH